MATHHGEGTCLRDGGELKGPISGFSRHPPPIPEGPPTFFASPRPPASAPPPLVTSPGEATRRKQVLDAEQFANVPSFPLALVRMAPVFVLFWLIVSAVWASERESGVTSYPGHHVQQHRDAVDQCGRTEAPWERLVPRLKAFHPKNRKGWGLLEPGGHSHGLPEALCH